MKILRELYSELINILVKNQVKYAEEELTIFSAGTGAFYKNEIMIVGRAVNGWKYYLDKHSMNSAQECNNSIQSKIENENLDWVKLSWGSTEGYNTKKSAFWRVAKLIAASVNSKIEFQTDSIVWTNLYKASKYEGGNPSIRLKNVEFDICKKLLDAEIDYYKPSCIVFLTGLSWAKDFLKDSETTDIHSTWEFVQQVGFYRETKYIVGQHPQGKNEINHTEEIVNQIK